MLSTLLMKLLNGKLRKECRKGSFVYYYMTEQCLFWYFKVVFYVDKNMIILVKYLHMIIYNVLLEIYLHQKANNHFYIHTRG